MLQFKWIWIICIICVTNQSACFQSRIANMKFVYDIDSYIDCDILLVDALC